MRAHANRELELPAGIREEEGSTRGPAPDVAVLCEAPLANPFEASLLDEPVSWRATGSLHHKGLAVAGRQGELRSRGAIEAPGRWGVAVTDQNGLGVLGAWSVPVPGRRYGDEVLGIIDAHADWLASGDVVVAGDFNIDANGVGNGTRGAELFATLVERLSALGLVSAYHSWTREAFGAESRRTHFHLRKANRGFHIDCCFVPEAWSGRIRDVVEPKERASSNRVRIHPAEAGVHNTGGGGHVAPLLLVERVVSCFTVGGVGSWGYGESCCCGVGVA